MSGHVALRPRHAAYKFTGIQGTSGYTFETWSSSEADNGTNMYRHKDAMYYLPTEDEWVKAAYWNGSNIQVWETPDDTEPVEDVEANYNWGAGSQPWDVGSGSIEINGTFDMIGNVEEWLESPWRDTSFGASSTRTLRGRSYSYVGTSFPLASSWRDDHYHPSVETSWMGFRVASEVPEPSTLGLLSLGGLMSMKRRRS